MFTGQGHEEEKKLEKVSIKIRRRRRRKKKEERRKKKEERRKKKEERRKKKKKDIWFVLVHMNAILCKVNFDIDWGK